MANHGGEDFEALARQYWSRWGEMLRAGADAGSASHGMPGANFSGANLTGANFSGAQMGGARGLTQRQLNTACGDSSTELPGSLTIPSC